MKKGYYCTQDRTLYAKTLSSKNIIRKPTFVQICKTFEEQNLGKCTTRQSNGNGHRASTVFDKKNPLNLIGEEKDAFINALAVYGVDLNDFITSYNKTDENENDSLDDNNIENNATASNYETPRLINKVRKSRVNKSNTITSGLEDIDEEVNSRPRIVTRLSSKCKGAN